MKKWSFFFTGIAVLAGLLYFAIQKNLFLVRNKPNVSPARLQEVIRPIPVPETPAPQTVIQTAVPDKSQETVATVAKIVKLKEKAVKEPSFIEGVFRIMEIYREGNQKFLNEDVTKADPVFERAFELSSELQATNSAEEKLKKQLMEATWARLGSIRFSNKIVENPDAETVDAWWHRNIDLLKKANESIINVVRMTGQLIQAQSETLADDKDSGLLLQDLERNAKGVLVVSKSPHS